MHGSPLLTLKWNSNKTHSNLLNFMKPNTNRNSGFSLVEVLAAVGIIGIIAFLAIPNIVAIKEDSEKQLAITRAEGINMGVAAYIQSNGVDAADAAWPVGDDASGTTTKAEARYALIRPYLSFAPTTLAEFQPAGYEIKPPLDLKALEKSELKPTGGSAFSY